MKERSAFSEHNEIVEDEEERAGRYRGPTLLHLFW